MKKLKIIAEIGSVHDGSLGNAIKLIELARECGAHAVKFQTHIPEHESLKNAPSPTYFNNESRFNYFKRTAFQLKEWKILRDVCIQNQVELVSSPFSHQAVDLLMNVGLETLKIASGEVSNVPLLEYIAGLDVKVILSSGMSDWTELDRAFEIFSDKSKLTVMQCSSMYPCNDFNVGINIIQEFSNRYQCEYGFSDHTMTTAASIGAVCFGATVIEKHITFSRKMYGSDAPNAMEPSEFGYFCSELNRIQNILNSPVDKNDLHQYQNMREVFQKSIVAAMDLSPQTTLGLNCFKFKKPGTGIPAAEYKRLMGRKLIRSVKKDQMLKEDDLL